MKKMIPVYVLQLAMLAMFVFVSFRVLREMESIREEIQASTGAVTESGPRQPRSAPAMRVIVVNEPLDVSINR